MSNKYTITLEYCAAWNYLPNAVRATEEILDNYQHVVGDLKLIPGRGGVFELTVNGNLAYSKKATGRHAETGEMVKILERIIGPEVPKYHDWYQNSDRLVHDWSGFCFFIDNSLISFAFTIE